MPSTAWRRFIHELLKQTVLSDFHRITPGKFFNVTNGVTPRRWMALSNPRLTALITRSIGDGWLSDLQGQLRKIEPLASRRRLSEGMAGRQRPETSRPWPTLIRERTGVSVDPHSLFDIQVKRLHEYKRQHLNVLHLVTLYNRLRRSSTARTTPRTVIFGGKAAPAYRMAKLIIRLITGVADVVNRDPIVSGSSRWCSCRISTSRTVIASIRLPISPSRSPPQGKRPRAPAT